MKIKATILICLLFWVVLISGCGEAVPRRDQIPILRENLYKLQVAVKEQNPAGIDSLLSTRILEKNQSSDSLLKLVYGPDISGVFGQFGNYEIVYTTNKARIDCTIMDSTHVNDRALALFYVYEHDLWLLSGFQAVDSAEAGE